MRQNEGELNCHEIITSNEYIDVFRRFFGDVESIAEEEGALCARRVFEDWVVFHFPLDGRDCTEFYFNSEFIDVPNLYGLSSINSIEAAGIGPVLRNPALDLTGKGILIGVIDTGINYLHEAFRYEDNTTKIINLWDQTIEGTPPEGFLYGAEYSSEQINEALASDDPYSIVPSRDEIGHGTFMAGVAAGRTNRQENFIGAAPDASLLVVKVKQAKDCVRNFFQVKADVPAYQTNDIGEGILYILQKAYAMNQPIVLISGLVSSDGPHNGTDEGEQILAASGTSLGTVVVTSAGNEANAAHHYHGYYEENETVKTIDLNVAETENGLFINAWAYLPDQITLEFISPSGATTGIIPYRSREWQEYKIPLESSVIHIYYDLLEERSAEEAIIIIIENPLPGLWQIKAHGEIIIDGRFDMYLPIRSFVDPQTIFLSPTPNTTITLPSTNRGTITVGAYNDVVNSLYLPSGRGYTRADLVKPDIVAPGVNIIGPGPNNQYVTMSGTSAAAAITGGACALLLEWGIIQGNDPIMNTIAVKTYLVRGARRRRGITYPNPEWGYGELDLINSIQNL